MKKTFGIIFIIIIIIFIVYKSQNTTSEENTNNEINNQSQNELINTVENEIINTEENEETEVNINEEETDNMSQKINLIVNNKTFSATLENNETTQELISMFPITLNMSDLNSNEKYNYLGTTLTTNSSRVNRINAGDIKLYGNNCLVVFYESFNTSYSYTNLGSVDNVSSFVDELGSGNVTITFEIAD